MLTGSCHDCHLCARVTDDGVMYYGGICQDSCKFNKLIYIKVLLLSKSVAHIGYLSLLLAQNTCLCEMCNLRMESETVVEIDGETVC